MKDNAGTHVFVFNSAGNPGALRPAGEMMVVGSNVLAHSLIYDALGRLQERRIASLTSAQHSETVGYDVLGRVTNVANPLGSFNYDYEGASNRLHQESLQGKNFMTNYVYESAAQDYRLKSIARSGLISAVPKTAYSTDAYRILNKNTEGGEQQSLRYDALDRLTGVVVSGVPNLIRNENYQYDATDNLTISAVVRLKDGNLFMKASEFTGQAMNRVKDETAFYNQKRAWVYDADGNVTSDGEAQYAWDAENRLKSVTKNGLTSTFAYDGLSRLHSRTENGQTTFYKWCDSHIKPCAAYGSDGKPKTLYLAQGEYETANAGKRYYLRDHLGSVQDVVSDSGTSLWHGEYTAYGQLMFERGEAVNRPVFGYAGMMKHYASGLNLTRYRAFNPNSGRWISTDPIGFAGGRNLYGYVGGNPINYFDSTGLLCEYSVSGKVVICRNSNNEIYYNEEAYSGKGLGRNSIQRQAQTGVGSTPLGRWQLTGGWYNSPNTGRNTIVIIPLEDNTCSNTGRDCSSFRIHGNNKNNDASEGCIILPLNRTNIPSGEIIEVVP